MTRMMNALSTLVVLSCIGASSAHAQVLFRMPLSMSACGNTCSVSAYYDTDRAGGLLDYGCGSWTYGQHDGTDYAVGGFPGMDTGRPVLAAAPGTVIAAHDGEFDRCTTANCGTANYVMIRHNDGKVSWYWHLKKWSVQVQVGQTVTCGQKLGEAGSSGLSTGPHLHFAAQYVQGGAVDDPYASPSGCGGSVSWWNAQGPYLSLPAPVCQGESTFCVGKASGYWCNGDTLTVCSAGSVSSETPCQHGCQGMPPGTPDQCAAAPAPTTGVVKGVVWDTSVTDDAAASLSLGARLPGTVISCSCGATATAREDDGLWSMEVAPGSYTLTATRDGYETVTREVQVTAGTEQWASMGLAPTPPPIEEEPVVEDPVDEEPVDEEPVVEEPGDEEPLDGGQNGGGPGEAPTGDDANVVLVPHEAVEPGAQGDSEGDSDDESALAGGCRCVSNPRDDQRMAGLFGVLFVGSVLFRKRRRGPEGA